MSIRRQSLRALAALLGIYLIVSLSRDLLGLLSSRERIAKAQDDVVKLQDEQQELALELEYVVSEDFVEKEAREKLLMGKPGEVVVLLPEEEEGMLPDGGGKSQVEEELANWEKWAQLFGFVF